MSFSSSHDDDAEMSEINMTPLVDVMLVLLIIFMITVPVLTQSVDIELPQASSASGKQAPDPITLSVDADGVFYWDNERIEMSVLKQRLKTTAEQQPQAQIHIRGDKKTAYEHVIQLMVSAQQVGLNRLGFITELRD